MRHSVQILALLVVFTAGMSAGYAADIWDGGGADASWSTGANWTDNSLPTTADDVVIQTPNLKSPIINSAAVCANLEVGKGYDLGTCELIMNSGASLTLTGTVDLKISSTAGSVGKFTMHGGTITGPRYFVVGNNGTGSMVMEGGSITSSSDFYIGNTTGSGTMTMKDGTISAGRYFYVGNDAAGSFVMENGSITSPNNIFCIGAASGAGTMEMKGGTITAPTFRIGNGKSDGTVTSVGHLKMSGGTINATSINGFDLARYAPAVGTMDFIDGTVNTKVLKIWRAGSVIDIKHGDFYVSDGNTLSTINGYISTKKIVGFGGQTTAHAEFVNQGGVQKIHVYADLISKAWDPDPNGTIVDSALANSLVLKWRAGKNAIKHHIYFGTDPNNLISYGEQTNTDPINSWDASANAGSLSIQTYYWRIDEEDAVGTIVTGDLWSFFMQNFGGMAFQIGPPDGAEETDGWKLVWQAGVAGGPYTHDVYLGDNYDEVLNAANTLSPCPGAGSIAGDWDGDCHVDIFDMATLAEKWLYPYEFENFATMANNWQLSGPYKGNQTQTEYYHHLRAGKTYYWRIDEVATNGDIVTGTMRSLNMVPKWTLNEFIVFIGWPNVRLSADPNAYLDRLIAMGINCIMDTSAVIDNCQQKGMKLMLTNKPAANAALTYKNHPALWGYFQDDEPGSSALTQIGLQHLQTHWSDARHPSYTNIQSINYGVSRTYVYDFINKVNPEILSFDFYQWYWSPTLIENLDFFRQVAIDNNIPLVSWVEVDAASSGGAENLARHRYSVYLNLAYGVKGIMWFSATYIFNDNGTIKNQGYYDDAQMINMELAHLGPELIGLTSTAVYHTGIGTVAHDHPASMTAIPAGHWVQITGNPFALGMFKNAQNEDYAMVMNRDKDNTHTATVSFQQAITEVRSFNQQDGTWQTLTLSGTPGDQSVQLSIIGGSGKLIKILR